MIIDYGPLPAAALDSIVPPIAGVAILLVFGLIILSMVLDRNRSKSPKMERVWWIGVLVFLLTIPTIVVLGTMQGGQADTIRDEHYPTIIAEAGYTDLQKIDNDEYAAQSPDGETVIVQVTLLEGHDDKFIVLEREQ